MSSMIEKRMKEHYQAIEDQGYEIVGLFLQGSQNYGLAYENSDIDTKAIVLPKFEDFVMSKKPVSYTHIMENNEHVDVKDIRLMFENFKKQNINFVEILFTKYKIMNPKYEALFQPMFNANEMIARYNVFTALNCMAGMSMEKFKALEHPYPATIEKIEKFSYDPKQLHHIIRLSEFMKRYIDGVPYSRCLISQNTEYLVNVKRGCHTLSEARELAYQHCEIAKQLKYDYMNDNSPWVERQVEEIMKKVLIDIMKYNFREEVLNNN